MTRFLIVSAICVALNLAPASAETLEGLIEQGRLQVSLGIETDPPYLQRTPVVLAVEIATPRWFSRGTRVRDFNIPTAVVRPVSNFADNQSRRIDGATWSAQRWRFRIFAQEPGRITVPALTLFASVNTEDAGVVEGELTLAALDIDIDAPRGAPDAPWFGAEALTANESWKGERETYFPGDALTRVRRFLITGAPAMAIEDSAEIRMAGVEVYTAPAQVADKQDRGRLAGEREERSVFTFQAPGTYVFPGRDVHWFNTQTSAFEVLPIPETSISVVAGAATGSAEDTESATRIPPSALLLPATVIATVIAAAVILRRRRWHGLSHNAVTERVLDAAAAGRARLAYTTACRRGDALRCVGLLYQRLGDRGDVQLRAAYRDEERIRTYERLMESAYTGAPPPSPAQLRRLWRFAPAPSGTATRASLRLNPAASSPYSRT